jgi:hypothetical protein
MTDYLTDYRIFVIGDDNHIMKRIEIDCADDDAAILSGQQYIDGHDIELWQRDRRIARFDTRPTVLQSTTDRSQDKPRRGISRRGLAMVW